MALKKIERKFGIDGSPYRNSVELCDGAGRNIVNFQNLFWVNRIELEGEVIIYSTVFSNKRPITVLAGSFREIKHGCYLFLFKNMFKNSGWQSNRRQVNAFNRKINRGLVKF